MIRPGYSQVTKAFADACGLDYQNIYPEFKAWPTSNMMVDSKLPSGTELKDEEGRIHVSVDLWEKYKTIEQENYGNTAAQYGGNLELLPGNILLTTHDNNGKTLEYLARN